MQTTKIKHLPKKTSPKNITKVIKSINETSQEKKGKVYICHISRNKLQVILLNNAIEVEVYTFSKFQSRKTQVMLWNNNSMTISETNWKKLNRNKN